MSKNKSLLILISFLFLKSIIGIGDSKCFARKQNDVTVEKANQAKCSKITVAAKCVKLDEICLWSSRGLFGESKTVSVKLIKQKILSAKAFDKAWAARSDYDNVKLPKPLNAEGLKKNFHITSIDKDNIMYEMQFTDFDAHDKFITQLYQSISKDVIEKQTTDMGVMDQIGEKGEYSKMSTRLFSKTKRVKVRRLINHNNALINNKYGLGFIRRRRLVETAVDNAEEHPYRSFGLIKVGTGSAGGTIIWVAPPGGPATFSAGGILHEHEDIHATFKHIYVLCAAHDLITRTGQQYAPIEDYTFWPQWNGATEALRRVYHGVGDTDETKKKRVSVLDQAWVLSGYIGRNSAYDVAIMRFRVDLTFERGHALAVNADAAAILPTRLTAPAVTKKMIAYNVGYYWQAPSERRYHMVTQNVPIVCDTDTDACHYDGQIMRPGYCGGPIVDGNNDIVAMQVAKQRIDPDLGPGCDDRPYTNCRGMAVRITGTHVTGFKWIGIYHWLPADWQVSHPYAQKSYDNYFDDDFDEYYEEYDEFDELGKQENLLYQLNYQIHQILEKQNDYNSNIMFISAMMLVLTICICGLCVCLFGVVAGLLGYFVTDKIEENQGK
eukprot:127508_1